jgi:hypothetical protein
MKPEESFVLGLTRFGASAVGRFFDSHSQVADA